MLPWSVLLVKRHTIHRALIDKSAPYERVIIYLDGKYFDRLMPSAALTDCFELADRQGRHLLCPEPAVQGMTAEEIATRCYVSRAAAIAAQENRRGCCEKTTCKKVEKLFEKGIDK